MDDPAEAPVQAAANTPRTGVAPIWAGRQTAAVRPALGLFGPEGSRNNTRAAPRPLSRLSVLPGSP